MYALPPMQFCSGVQNEEIQQELHEHLPLMLPHRGLHGVGATECVRSILADNYDLASLVSLDLIWSTFRLVLRHRSCHACLRLLEVRKGEGETHAMCFPAFQCGPCQWLQLSPCPLWHHIIRQPSVCMEMTSLVVIPLFLFYLCLMFGAEKCQHCGLRRR